MKDCSEIPSDGDCLGLSEVLLDVGRAVPSCRDYGTAIRDVPRAVPSHKCRAVGLNTEPHG